MEHAAESSADLSPKSSDWKFHKHFIRHLYVEQNLPLEKVMKQMREESRFEATQRQYKRQLKIWDFRKNIAVADMRVIVRIWQREGGKDMVFRLRGRIVPPRKIERWIKRQEGKADSGRVGSGEVENEVSEAETLKHLEYWRRDKTKNDVDERDEITDSSSEDEDPDYPTREAEGPLAKNAIGALSPTTGVPCKGNCQITQASTDWKSSVINSEDAARHETKDLKFSKSTNDQAFDGKAPMATSSPRVNQADQWGAKQRTKKRVLDIRDDEDNHGGRPDGHHTKQQRGIKFSCPYRKRNPSTFNVRTNKTCALMSFPNIAELKRHVVTYHEREPVCLGCGEIFLGSDQLTQHRRASQPCVLSVKWQNLDPEHGITLEIKDTLRSRRAHSKVTTWEQLWKVLFPDDQDIPEPGKDFQPPLEIKEAGDFLINRADQFASEVMGLLMPPPHPQKHDLHCEISQAYKDFVQRALLKFHDTLSSPESGKEGIPDLQSNSEETVATISTWWPPSPDLTPTDLSLQPSQGNGDEDIHWNFLDLEADDSVSYFPGTFLDLHQSQLNADTND